MTPARVGAYTSDNVHRDNPRSTRDAALVATPGVGGSVAVACGTPPMPVPVAENVPEGAEFDVAEG